MDAREIRKRNDAERMQSLAYWAAYVTTHSDRAWSKQQNALINGLLNRPSLLSAKQYLQLKKEVCKR